MQSSIFAKLSPLAQLARLQKQKEEIDKYRIDSNNGVAIKELHLTEDGATKNFENDNATINDLLENSTLLNKYDFSDIEYAQDLINDNVYSIDIDKNIDLIELLNIIVNINDKIGSKLYGIILDTRNFGSVNITHFVKFAFFDSKDNIELNKIHVYTYKEEPNIDDFTYEYSKNVLLKSYALIKTDTRFFIDTIKSVSSIEKQRFMEHLHCLITDFFRNTKNEEVEYFYSLTPNDLVVSGLMLPFYGVTLSRRKADNTISRDLLRMRSANIGSHEYSDIDNWGATCTGSLSNKENEGIATLSKSNLGSPYRRDIFGNDFQSCAKASIDLTIAVMKRIINDNR